MRAVWRPVWVFFFVRGIFFSLEGKFGWIEEFDLRLFFFFFSHGVEGRSTACFKGLWIEKQSSKSEVSSDGSN